MYMHTPLPFQRITNQCGFHKGSGMYIPGNPIYSDMDLTDHPGDSDMTVLGQHSDMDIIKIQALGKMGILTIILLVKNHQVTW